MVVKETRMFIYLLERGNQRFVGASIRNVGSELVRHKNYFAEEDTTCYIYHVDNITDTWNKVKVKLASSNYILSSGMLRVDISDEDMMSIKDMLQEVANKDVDVIPMNTIMTVSMIRALDVPRSDAKDILMSLDGYKDLRLRHYYDLYGTDHGDWESGISSLDRMYEEVVREIILKYGTGH